MLRAGVCINCAEKIAAVILESGPGDTAVERERRTPALWRGGEVQLNRLAATMRERP
jgi:hypothetical protein